MNRRSPASPTTRTMYEVRTGRRVTANVSTETSDNAPVVSCPTIHPADRSRRTVLGATFLLPSSRTQVSCDQILQPDRASAPLEAVRPERSSERSTTRPRSCSTLPCSCDASGKGMPKDSAVPPTFLYDLLRNMRTKEKLLEPKRLDRRLSVEPACRAACD
jgi:hypothetical protein